MKLSILEQFLLGNRVLENKLNYEVHGGDLQYVEMNLEPGQSVISEPGTMLYMEQGIQMSTKMTDGSDKHKGVLGTVSGMGKRYFAGEDMFVTFFTNNGSVPYKVAFSANYLGKIQAVDLKECGGEILCQRGGYLCSSSGTALSVGFTKKLGAGLFGGEGFLLQKVQGDGVAFIHASGSIKEFNLEAGKTIFVDTGSLVGFQKGVDFDIQTVRGLKNMLFGGEEIFLSKLTGPGKVWIQSLPYAKMVGQLTHSVIKILADKKG